MLLHVFIYLHIFARFFLDQKIADLKHLKTLTENTADSKTEKKKNTGFALCSVCV